MNHEDAPKANAQAPPHDERRRSQRVTLRVPVKLHVSTSGKSATIHAFTADVNDHGALLNCPQNFPTNARFILEHAQTRRRMGCRVTRTPQPVHNGFLVPVEFDEGAPGFWHISFPPTNWTAPTE